MLRTEFFELRLTPSETYPFIYCSFLLEGGVLAPDQKFYVCGSLCKNNQRLTLLRYCLSSATNKESTNSYNESFGKKEQWARPDSNRRPPPCESPCRILDPLLSFLMFAVRNHEKGRLAVMPGLKNSGISTD